MAEVIGVRFKQVGKVYYFDPSGMSFRRDDHIIVDTSRGIEYGFDEQEIDEYFAGRLQCYKNAALADPLARLARSPMRKLGRHERIIGAAELCHGYGISLEAFAPVLYCAVNYFSFQDEESIRLAILKERKGVEAVLREVCGLDPESELFRQLLQILSLKDDLALGHLAGGEVEQAHNRQGGNALAAARLAYQTEDFTFIDVKADLVDRCYAGFFA